MKAIHILKMWKQGYCTEDYEIDEAIEELEKLQKRIDDINYLKRVQSDSSIDGNTIGLYNGLEFASSILENREPVYINIWNFMNNELNYGDIYFKNDILTVTFKQQEEYVRENWTYGPYSYFEVIFLNGEPNKYFCNKESIDKLISKRLGAYNLIPKGCKIIPKELVGHFQGMLIGGVLEDSIQIVYGLAEPTIKGFSCSVFFIPSDEVLVTLTNYNSVSGALKIKGDNYDTNKM